MPKFRVTSPEGKTYEVSAPDGATQEDAIAYVQKNMAKNAPEMGRAEALGRGAVYGALQQPRDVLAAGYASLLSDIGFKEALSEARNMSLEGQQGVAKERLPGYFGTGEALGNIAISLAPAGAATRAIGATAPALETMGGAGTALGRLAGNIGASRGIAGTLGAGAVEGGVLSALTQGDLSGALPGAAGAGAVGAIGKIANPIGESASSAVRRGYEKILENAGINNLTAAQKTGSKTLELTESVLGELPFSAGPARKRIEGQLEKFTSAALKTAGINAKLATPDVLESAAQSFNNKFKKAISSTVVDLDSQAQKELSDIAASQVSKLPTNVKSVVESYLDDLKNAGSSISGDAYQTARSALSAQAKSIMGSDSYTASVLRSIRNTLDDAAERSLPTAKKGQWQELRKQYRNYKTIRKASERVSKDSLEGYISPASLLQAAKGQKDELYKLARAGRSILTDSVPNSGTAQRQLIQSILTGGGTAGLTYGVTQDPQSALLALGATLGGPRAAQALINSPVGKQYLTRGVPFLKELGTQQSKRQSALLGAAGGDDPPFVVDAQGNTYAY